MSEMRSKLFDWHEYVVLESIYFYFVDSVVCGCDPFAAGIIFLTYCLYCVNHLLKYCELTPTSVLVFSSAWGGGGGYYSVSSVVVFFNYY